jgi:dTDP-4-amino-4,6-dideoxygalactose transaminase
MKHEISFSRPWLNGDEVSFVSRALQAGGIGGRGTFTELVEARLGQLHDCHDVIFTNSGSTALLVALLSFKLKPGERVIVPSFGFVALPQAVILAGGEPLFVDVDLKTGSISPDSLRFINPHNVRGVIVIHYGGIAADMQGILRIAHDQGWFVLEDAAHGFSGKHNLGELGTLGTVGILSFDHQKNVHCGEGGAVILGDPGRAATVRSISGLGTNGHDVIRGVSRDFDWMEKGVKGYPPDYVAAFLLSQLDSLDFVQTTRRTQWSLYNSQLGNWSESLSILRPKLSPHATHPTWHIFWLTFRSESEATSFIDWMEGRGIECRRHYSSLAHLSMGARYESEPTPASDHLSKSLVRLPLGPHLSDNHLEQIVTAILEWPPEATGVIGT